MSQIATVAEHLKALKKCLFRCLLVYLVLFVVFLTQAGNIINALTSTVLSAGYQITTLGPQESLAQELRVCGCGALIASLPFILYEAAVFYYQPSKGKLKMFLKIIVVMLLFTAGGAFAVFLLLPFMFRFLIDITGSLAGVTATVTLEKCVGFYLSNITVFGLITEMPAVTWLLARAGLASHSLLKKIRPYAIIVIFIVSAIITPPDVVSQVMVAVPICGIYELCIIISRVSKKCKKEGKVYEFNT